MPVPMIGSLTVLQFLLNTTSFNLKVRLAKSILPADQAAIVLADLTEADFSGYAPIVNPTMSAPVINTSDYAESVSEPLIWTVGPAPTPQTVTALYVTEAEVAGPDKLLFIQPLPAGITLSLEGQQFMKQLRIMVANLPV